MTDSQSLETQTYAVRLQQRIANEQVALMAVTSALAEAMHKSGFGSQAEILQQPLCNPELRRDTLDGTDSFYAEWRTATGALKGYVLIHAGGQVYAECDVVAPHPTDKRWFVEAITAWGRADQIKAEPRMLPALQ